MKKLTIILAFFVVNLLSNSSVMAMSETSAVTLSTVNTEITHYIKIDASLPLKLKTAYVGTVEVENNTDERRPEKPTKVKFRQI